MDAGMRAEGAPGGAVSQGVLPILGADDVCIGKGGAKLGDRAGREAGAAGEVDGFECG